MKNPSSTGEGFYFSGKSAVDFSLFRGMIFSDGGPVNEKKYRRYFSPDGFSGFVL